MGPVLQTPKQIAKTTEKIQEDLDLIANLGGVVNIDDPSYTDHIGHDVAVVVNTLFISGDDVTRRVTLKSDGRRSFYCNENIGLVIQRPQVTVEGISFDGWQVKPMSGHGILILPGFTTDRRPPYSANVQNVLIRECMFQDFHDAAIHIANGEVVEVSNCYFNSFNAYKKGKRAIGVLVANMTPPTKEAGCDTKDDDDPRPGYDPPRVIKLQSLMMTFHGTSVVCNNPSPRRGGLHQLHISDCYLNGFLKCGIDIQDTQPVSIESVYLEGESAGKTETGISIRRSEIHFANSHTNPPPGKSPFKAPHGRQIIKNVSFSGHIKWIVQLWQTEARLSGCTFFSLNPDADVEDRYKYRVGGWEHRLNIQSESVVDFILS